MQSDLISSLVPPSSGGDGHCPAASGPLDLQSKSPGLVPGQWAGELPFALMLPVASWALLTRLNDQITGETQLRGVGGSAAISISPSSPIHSLPPCLLLQGASLDSDMLQEKAEPGSLIQDLSSQSFRKGRLRCAAQMAAPSCSPGQNHGV